MNGDSKHSLPIQAARQRCNRSCGLQRWKWFIFKDVAAYFHYFKVLLISMVFEWVIQECIKKQLPGYGAFRIPTKWCFRLILSRALLAKPWEPICCRHHFTAQDVICSMEGAFAASLTLCWNVEDQPTNTSVIYGFVVLWLFQKKKRKKETISLLPPAGADNNPLS